MINEPKKRDSSRLLIGLGLILTGLMLALNLTEYMMVSQKIRQYSCEVTHLQGVVDSIKYLDRLTEAQTNENVKAMVGAVAQNFKENAQFITPETCVDVELTYLEVQWYRLKQALETPADQ